HYVTSHPTEPEVLYAALGYASLSRPEWRTENGAELGGGGRAYGGGRGGAKAGTAHTPPGRGPPAAPAQERPAPAPRGGPRRPGGGGWPRRPDRRLLRRRRHVAPGSRRDRDADARHGRALRRRSGRSCLGDLLGRAAPERDPRRVALAAGADCRSRVEGG